MSKTKYFNGNHQWSQLWCWIGVTWMFEITNERQWYSKSTFEMLDKIFQSDYLHMRWWYDQWNALLRFTLGNWEKQWVRQHAFRKFKYYSVSSLPGLQCLYQQPSASSRNFRKFQRPIWQEVSQNRQTNSSNPVSRGQKLNRSTEKTFRNRWDNDYTQRRCKTFWRWDRKIGKFQWRKKNASKVRFWNHWSRRIVLLRSGTSSNGLWRKLWGININLRLFCF